MTTVERTGEDSFRISMSVSAPVLGFVARNLYEIEGLTHEQVTAWLEKHVPDFRRVLVDAICVGADGETETRWVPRGEAYTVRFE